MSTFSLCTSFKGVQKVPGTFPDKAEAKNRLAFSDTVTRESRDRCLRAFVLREAGGVLVSFDATVASLELREAIAVAVVLDEFLGAVGVGDLREVVEAVVFEAISVRPGVFRGEQIALI